MPVYNNFVGTSNVAEMSVFPGSAQTEEEVSSKTKRIQSPSALANLKAQEKFPQIVPQDQ